MLWNKNWIWHSFARMAPLMFYFKMFSTSLVSFNIHVHVYRALRICIAIEAKLSMLRNGNSLPLKRGLWHRGLKNANIRSPPLRSHYTASMHTLRCYQCSVTLIFCHLLNFEDRPINELSMRPWKYMLRFGTWTNNTKFTHPSVKGRIDLPNAKNCYIKTYPNAISFFRISTYL